MSTTKWYAKYLGENKTFDDENRPKIEEDPSVTERSNKKGIDCYDISPINGQKRGLAIIMTNDFHGTNSAIHYAWEDGIMMWKMFEQLDFKVIWYTNQRRTDMISALRGAVNRDMEGQIIACCISSHGQDSVVLGQDGKCLLIKDIIDPLARHSSDIGKKLEEKPKLFFINACQGSLAREAYRKDETGDEKMLFEVTKNYSIIAENADVLLSFATFQGDAAWAVEKGSYYVNELTKCLPYHPKEDIHVILARVCNEVKSIHRKNKTEAQLPMVLSTLTKKLVI